MATNNQRREAARRQLEQQLAQRQRQQSHKRGQVLIVSIAASVVVVILAVVLIAVLNRGSDKKTVAAGAATSSAAAPATDSAAAAPTAAATSAAPTTPGTCTFTSEGTASKAATLPPLTGNAVTGTATVTMTTSAGTIAVQVDRSLAPCTVESFLSLATQKYYDSTKCHRLVTSGIYVLQCGDPTASGSGGPGYTIPDEATGQETYPAGTLAMARTSTAHSGGSQFFFVYKDSPALAQNLGALQYTVFGKVTQGLDVLQKVGDAGVADGSTDGAPKTPVEIQTVTVS